MTKAAPFSPGGFLFLAGHSARGAFSAGFLGPALAGSEA